MECRFRSAAERPVGAAPPVPIGRRLRLEEASRQRRPGVGLAPEALRHRAGHSTASVVRVPGGKKLRFRPRVLPASSAPRAGARALPRRVAVRGLAPHRPAPEARAVASKSRREKRERREIDGYLSASRQGGELASPRPALPLKVRAIIKEKTSRAESNVFIRPARCATKCSGGGCKKRPPVATKGAGCARQLAGRASCLQRARSGVRAMLYKCAVPPFPKSASFITNANKVCRIW
jgi:hypothetical protein